MARYIVVVCGENLSWRDRGAQISTYSQGVAKMKTIRKSAHLSIILILPAVLIATIMLARMANAQTAGGATTQGQVTFTKDIAPILQDKCQSCHRDGAMAPMALTSYQEARPYARAIKQRVVLRTMPPWFIDKSVGIQHFSNDISLSDAEIATIVKWVDEGAPQGDPKDMPPPKVFNDGGWKLAKILGRQPDVILEGTDYTVKAHDQDQWYRPTTDVGLTEPRWAMAVEMRPSTQESRQVFHHIIATLDQDETNAPSAQVKISLASSKDRIGGGSVHNGAMLMEYAVGKNFDIFREGTGKLIMPGAKINWEYHTHATDHDVTGHPQLAVYLYPKEQTPRYRTEDLGPRAMPSFGEGGLDMRPNSVHFSQGFTVLPAPGRLENFQPHMHLRGKAMAMEAILPDGATEMLSYVDRFNFNWMVNYIYADDAAPVLPRGTVIHLMAWHDNTTSNPNNPDPNQWVGWGERSVDDMALAHVNVTYISDEDYQAWAAQHPKKGPGGGKPEGTASTPEPSAVQKR
jgi:hypothetical protein